jgi:catechol 2,3-dioxygenase
VNIGHVHLKTGALEPMEGFYCGLLGFEVTARLPGALFVASGGYHHHLAFNTWESAGGSPPPPGCTGLYHVAIRFDTRAELAACLRRLRSAQWKLDGASDHGTHEALYLRDPDENGVELYWDRSPEVWPRSESGELVFSTQRLDVEALAAL